ncbi:Rhs element Vgr protein (plasmid) [Scytonema sp. HK-05]|uniref:VgrG-related protein n=1 Tax=Scytonema sp. HK-05 TaxID=1137095 RepID=UPI0009358BB3|nr:VgrG-related protein [Scytonema sp. HK-05]OKH54461.1 type IV secretion protein Rhs [Scytonema sp. HK-05]BAY49989.1 Rhs element Vgr protein [Scytonema sp. HK-05]
MSNQSLYLSRPLLKINGKPAPPELVEDIIEISVEESLHLPSMFTLVVHNVYDSADQEDKQPWKNEKYFKIGDSLDIGFATSTTKSSEFSKEEQNYLIQKGEIVAIEVSFTDKSDAPIIIRGYDTAHRLHHGRHNRSFLNQTAGEIVKKIAQEVGIKVDQVDNKGVPYDYLFQENQTNWEFLHELAALNGMELFVQDNKLNFRTPSSKPSLKLKWLIDITHFHPRATSAQQVKSVEVRSWDYTKKQPIISTASSEKVVTKTSIGQGSSTSSDFHLKQPPEMIVVDKPVSTQQQADVIAQALCNELGGDFISADGRAEGNPQIRPAQIISLEGIGDLFSGDYYVTETRHLYRERVYKTEFSVRGLRSNSLLTTIAPPVRLRPAQTFLTGIVTDNHDKQNMGRVKVKFPTLSNEKDSSNWARVVGLGAGQNRGFYCLPEIGDEVLVGFEHGNITRPYIIGAVWNGPDTPPEAVKDTIHNGKVRLRTIKTRRGHTIEFVEEDLGSGTEDKNCAGVYIRTFGRHHVSMKDSPSAKGVTIQTSGGHQINLNDTPQKSIEIRTSRGQHLTFDDEAMTVTLQAGGIINIQAAAEVSINAEGTVAINAEAAVAITAAFEMNLKAASITMEAESIAMVAPIVIVNGVPLG